MRRSESHARSGDSRAFGPLFESNQEQIRRVEELSDAYHITLGDTDVTVACLLEVERDVPAGDATS